MIILGSWLVLFSVAIVDVSTGEKNYLFHIPWACSIVYKRADQSIFLGAGTILDMETVLVSVDNLNEMIPLPELYPPKRFYEDLDHIWVHAGTNYLDPTKLQKPPSVSQTRNATKLFVAFDLPELNHGGKWDIRLNPTGEISEKTGAWFDTYGLAFNVGILKVAKRFEASPYVQLALIKGPNLTRRTVHFIRHLDSYNNQDWMHPCITYSWNEKLNKIRYHAVTYQPSKNCFEVFCTWDLAHCRSFPDKDYLTCFKSVKYADVCPNARGAALYCPDFENSVFAILTTAPSCGQRHMPGVYTTFPLIVKFFEKATNTSFDIDHRPEYDLYSLAQKNDDYEGVL